MYRQITRLTGYHAHFVQILQIVHRSHAFALWHQHDLGNGVIRIAERHGLFALIRHGNGRNDGIGVAGVDGGEQAFPRLVFVFHLETTRFAQGIHQINVEAFHFAFRRDGFKWGKFGIQRNFVCFTCSRCRITASSWCAACRFSGIRRLTTTCT